MANCGQCGGRGAGADGVCRSCRLRRFGQASRKYFFTEALTQDLKAAYWGNKRRLSAQLEKLERRTGWPRYAFKNEAIRLGLPRKRLVGLVVCQPREGYNLGDLCTVLGVHYSTARGWMRRGLLGNARQADSLRVSDSDVARFIRECAHEYDLRRVDQVWFKSMAFGRRADYKEKA